MLEKIPPELAGFFIAIILSFARIMGDKKEGKPMRILIESVICGGLSLTVAYGVLALGLSNFWSGFLGGMIGYLGSATVREFALIFINKKLGKGKDENKSD